jgi:hypothetical protein
MEGLVKVLVPLHVVGCGADRRWNLEARVVDIEVFRATVGYLLRAVSE